jgi:hypothetical protein
MAKETLWYSRYFTENERRQFNYQIDIMNDDVIPLKLDKA